VRKEGRKEALNKGGREGRGAGARSGSLGRCGKTDKETYVYLPQLAGPLPQKELFENQRESKKNQEKLQKTKLICYTIP